MIAESDAIKELTRQRDEAEALADYWRRIASTPPESSLPGQYVGNLTTSEREAATILIAEVAKGYGVTAHDLTGGRRLDPLPEARAICMLLLRDVLGMSTPKAGLMIGRTHSTVIKMSQAIEGRADKSERFAAHLVRLKEFAIAEIENVTGKKWRTVRRRGITRKETNQ